MALTLQNDTLFQAFSLLVLQKRSMAKDITHNYDKLQCFGVIGDALLQSVLTYQWMAMDKLSGLSE